MTDTATIEGIRAEIEALQAQLTAKKAELRALRGTSGKAKAKPKECACGCGELTRGGEFLPGHDARFRGRLLRQIDAGDESALTQLLARPTLLHGASEESLRERLGSDQRKTEAQVAAKIEREAAKATKTKPEAKPAAKAVKPRVDPTQAQQGSRSNQVRKNGTAIRNAKQRVAA
jgi:hypothetical protein